MNFADLNTPEGFESFLAIYHKLLNENLSFPPLKVNKALHLAAAAFGCKNWNELSANIKSHPFALARSVGLPRNILNIKLRHTNGIDETYYEDVEVENTSEGIAGFIIEHGESLGRLPSGLFMSDDEFYPSEDYYPSEAEESLLMLSTDTLIQIAILIIPHIVSYEEIASQPQVISHEEVVRADKMAGAPEAEMVSLPLLNPEEAGGEALIVNKKLADKIKEFAKSVTPSIDEAYSLIRTSGLEGWRFQSQENTPLAQANEAADEDEGEEALDLCTSVYDDPELPFESAYLELRFDVEQGAILGVKSFKCHRDDPEHEAIQFGGCDCEPSDMLTKLADAKLKEGADYLIQHFAKHGYAITYDQDNSFWMD